mmetsp:Transcript_8398/g.15254  ORF Transcript_8398/g.15254 Transcript_8398/m.15254 type:complete len:288 (-) Transcript_8398:6-869(-)
MRSSYPVLPTPKIPPAVPPSIRLIRSMTSSLRRIMIDLGLTRDRYALPTTSTPNHNPNEAFMNPFRPLQPPSKLPPPHIPSLLSTVITKLLYHLQLPKIILLTYFLTFLSSYLISTSYLNLYDHTNHINLSCTVSTCRYTTYTFDSYSYSVFPVWSEDVYTFSRSDFDRVASVRVKKGEIVSVQGLKRRQLRKLGYSYAVSVGEGEQRILSVGNLGKRASREKVAQLNQRFRMNGPFKNEEGKAFCVASLMKIGMGIFMVAFVSMVGEWSVASFRERYGDDGEGKNA